MGILSDLGGEIRDRVIVQPIVNYLRNEAEKKADLSKAQRDSNFAVNPAGPLIRDQLQMGSTYAQYGSTRSKPGSSVDYVTLRRFSEQYDVARAVINRRKRQLNTLEWAIVPKDKENKEAANNKNLINEIREIVDDLGGYKVRFRELLDTMVEDLLVLDALAIYKRPTVGGGLYSLEVIDASTIQLRVDPGGGTPEPPEVAYKQVIRGTTMFEFTADEMYYEMMNPRSSSPYGLSPLESFVIGVSTALKSDIYNLHMLTEGNIPEGLYSVPDTWNPAQVREFQEVWDAMLAGDSRATSKMKFVPPGQYTPTTKPEDIRYKELQEWLMKKMCMLYEIQPQELGFTDTVNKSTGEVQDDIGERSGLIPLVQFFQEIFADVIQIDLGYTDYKLVWLGVDNDNAKEIAETDEIRVRSGMFTVDEVRAEKGLEPLGVSKPFVSSGTPTFIDDESVQAANDAKAAAAQAQADAAAARAKGDQTPTDQNGDGPAGGGGETETLGTPTDKAITSQIELVSELRSFRKYAISRAGKKMLRKFESKVLPQEVSDEINTRVSKAADKDAVRAIFAEYMKDYQIDFLASVVDFKQSVAKVLE